MELVDFLKKYSKINNKFIDDFFGMYDIKNKESYSVDLDKMAKWLKIRKSTIKKTLLKTYIEDVDYMVNGIVKVKGSGSGGQNKETIMLTSDCFKLISMKSHSERAEKVRKYYLELEKLIDDYKNYIIAGLNDKLEKLLNNQKPLINQKKGIIYVIQTADDISLYKIGKTTNLKSRLKNYNSDKADNIKPVLIYETDNIDEIEKCIKIYAKEYQYRKYKEVYQISIDMLKDIITTCINTSCKMDLIKKRKPLQQKGGNYYLVFDNQINDDNDDNDDV